MALRILILSILLTILAACATGPKFDASRVNKTITPAMATADFAQAKEARILWGGVIIAVTNLQNTTQLEVLGYPLDSEQRPDTDKPPVGRFLAINPGYLETIDYAQGRLVTVTGALSELKEGRIGESIYNYPVVNIEQIFLWPKTNHTTTPEPQLRFGIGVIFR